MIATDTAYYIIITDKNNCIDTLSLTIKAVDPMDSYMSVQGVICKDDNSGEASVFINGGVAPYNFIWDIDTSTIITDNMFSHINALLPGQYTVKIIDDMGCIITDSIIIRSDPSICLNIYRAFSPNYDGVNDFWEIQNIHLYPEALILIYDRNGRQVYRRRNYKNEFAVAFSGKDQQGRVLPSGTYYYILDLENGDNEFKGTVSIVR
jgi:gliding motility-associated-like protein